jgi:tetratricopeptide (TPR) repeat protein/tRNA A-37 threonylcarbamoyl transferase component Bud32
MTSAAELQLARLAVERGLLTAEQLEAALAELKTSPGLSLPAVLVRRGPLKAQDVDALQDELKRRAAPGAEISDPKLEDALLGRLLIRQGLLKEAQLYDCLREAADAGAGAPMRLGEILVRKGYLGGEAAAKPAPRKSGLVCRACGAHFTASAVEAGKTLACKQCGAPLEREAPTGLGETTETLKVDMPEDALKASKDPARHFAGGKYYLVEEVGRGGMGVVWKAWQKDLKRYVAVKILIGTLWTDVEIKRFYREAQMAASLSHPNIASIYEVGTHDGKHFISMEFVEGDSLARIMTPSSRAGTQRAVKHLPPRRAIEILREVALAVDYAHSKGIIHRDLKPHNIWAPRGDARIYVMDFGLAKPIRSGDSITVSDAIVGTPQYMSPEQARGETVDRRTDIWSLGAVLYHVLTGRPPFEGRSPAETMMSVLADDPDPMRKLNPRIHADVETICLKALDKDRDRRYDSARSFADDLGRYLEGEPIGARPLSRRERAWRALRRRPLATAVAMTALASALLLAIFLGVLSFRRSLELEEFAKFAHAAFKERKFDEAKEWWARILREDPENEEAVAGFELAHLQADNLRKEADREKQRAKASIRDNHATGDVFFKEGLFARALGCYQQILALDPMDALAGQRKKECEAAIVRKEQEAEDLKGDIEEFTIERKQREAEDERRRQARLRAMPDYEAARVLVEKAARIRLSADGYTVQHVRDMYREAREALSRAIARDATYAEAYFFRGQLRHKLGEFERAIDDFRDALKYSSDSGPAPFGAALACLSLYMIHAWTPLAPDPEARADSLARMLEWSRTAADKSHNAFERFCAAALADLHLRQFEKAEDKVRTVAQAGLGNPAYHLILASVALESANFRAAEQELTALLQLDPTCTEALFLRSVARARTENLAGALQDAALAVETAPENKGVLSTVHILKAQLHHDLDEPEAAVAELSKAVNYVPGRVAAQLNRLIAQWKRGARADGPSPK